MDLIHSDAADTFVCDALQRHEQLEEVVPLLHVFDAAISSQLELIALWFLNKAALLHAEA